MHGGAAVGVLVLLLVGIPALSLMRNAARSRGSQGQPRAVGGGLLSGWLAHRRQLRLEQVRHENRAALAWARHRQRIIEQRERDARARPAGTAPYDPDGTAGDDDGWTRETTDRGGFPPDSGSGWRATVTHVWGRWHPAGDAARPGREPRPAVGPAAPPVPAPGSPEGHRETTAPPGPPRSPEPPARGGGSPAPPGRPAPGPDPIPTLKGTIVTTPAVTPEAVPGAEMVIEGLRRIYAHAMAGNIQAKRRAVLALAEVARRAALTAMTLARSMAEPGQHYGTAVTERLGRMAAIFTAAHSAGTEVDSELRVILNTPPGEAMAAGRPMPHHDEFAESGSR